MKIVTMIALAVIASLSTVGCMAATDSESDEVADTDDGRTGEGEAALISQGDGTTSGGTSYSCGTTGCRCSGTADCVGMTLECQKRGTKGIWCVGDVCWCNF